MNEYKFKKFENLKFTIKRFNVYFLHGLLHDTHEIPLKNFYTYWGISLIKLLKDKPHISCRTIRFDNKTDEAWTDINVIIGDGIITFAYHSDVWSSRLGIKIPEFEDWNIESAILESQGMNEVHIFNPKVVGICININKIEDDGGVINNTINKFKLIPKKERPKCNGIYKPQYTDYVDIQEKAQKYKLSVYGLLNGKLYSLTYKNNKFFLDKEKKPKDVIA